jgi:CRISPR/Cas system endoribonuclease Cas6 (RAMP superfamily)
LPERESVKAEEADNLPVILIPIYQAFQKIGPEFTYTDLKNYLEIRIFDSDTWIFYEKLLYSMKYTYNEFRNKEHDADMKKLDKKNKLDK